ncbi:hypothetical protein N7481_013046 [Penicillium waksmanii]|uniref:uncharacterized protein n=1 Tax=Penicillium waksmanii TaxID=69791 RepID=UPI002546F72E|nr:uncharacterized protein N7481_013046 [Penicillium waksmanii]KAJ5966332.1 hypothetical protein N7481_013046 [Penicillium waksmanii]
MSTNRPVRVALEAIGNTPCIELQNVVPEDCVRVFLKLEGLNPTGSYKERMARAVIEEAERRGDLKPGMTVVEATGGIVSSNAFAEEKLKTMAANGATVEGAGMGMGVCRILKSHYADCRVTVLEPASAPMITKGYEGPHSVEGIGIGFIPPLLDKSLYDDARAVDESEGRVISQRVAKEEGVLAGTSTGLNVVAAIQLAKELGPGNIVATVVCDSGLKYLQGDLFTEKIEDCILFET